MTSIQRILLIIRIIPPIFCLFWAVDLSVGLTRGGGCNSYHIYFVHILYSHQTDPGYGTVPEWEKSIITQLIRRTGWNV